MAARVMKAVVFGFALAGPVTPPANAQEIVDLSYMNIWVADRTVVLAQLRKRLPDPDHARVRRLTQISSHTACGEVSYAPGIEPFKQFCFGLIGGATF